MIATRCATTPGFPAAVLAILLAGCASRPPRTTSLLVAAMERQLQEAQGERERIEREIWRLRQAIQEDRAELAVVRQRSAEVSEELSVALTDLDAQLSLLRAAEEDLGQAKARMEEIQKQLEPLADLERRLAAKDAKMAELQEQVETAERELAERQEQVATRLGELQVQARAVEILDQRVQEALDSVREAAGPFQPELPQAPATEPPPAKQPGKQPGKQPSPDGKK